jgi:hypothetical protein
MENWQRLVKPLEFGRHDAVAQVHGRSRVLHGPIIDDHQLLHIVRNGGAGIGGQLSRRHGSRRGQQQSWNINLHESLEQVHPPGLAIFASWARERDAMQPQVPA